MSAFVVGHFEIKDEEGFNSYAERGLKIVAAAGGEVAAGGKLARVLNGGRSGSAFVLLKFPDQEAVGKWYDSDAYQALIPDRNKAADVTFLSYDETS